MTHTTATLAAVAVILGTLFSIVGVLGLVRLPDVYSRLHATGKVSVFGVTILLLAAIALDIAGVGKALVLIGYLILAGPVLSHALAAAARKAGVRLEGEDQPQRE